MGTCVYAVKFRYASEQQKDPQPKLTGCYRTQTPEPLDHENRSKRFGNFAIPN